MADTFGETKRPSKDGLFYVNREDRLIASGTGDAVC